MKRIIWVVIVVYVFFESHSLAFAENFEDGLAAKGRGDFRTAFEKWKPLAEQGDAYAQCSLGLTYRKGEGVAQDHKEAVKWYKLAAEQGDAAAQCNLGAMYYEGKGVAQNYIEAHKWFNISGANGSMEGLSNRDLIEKRMTPSEITEAQRLAKEWMETHEK